MKPQRSYTSPQREQQAAATRQRILATATTLFGKHGFAAVTIGSIAREAGVSPATVYLHFASKPAIVQALADDVVAMPDLSVELFEHETGPVQQLRIGARIMRQLNERSWLIANILRSASEGNEELNTIRRQWQQRHLQAVARAMESLHQQGALREGLALNEAVDVFFTIAGTGVYGTLTGERGWTPEQYEQWLFQFGCRELLGMEDARVSAEDQMSHRTEGPVVFNEDVRRLLHQPSFARLATLLPDGSPQMTVMWFREVDGVLRMITPASTKKVANLERDSRVAVIIEDPENPYDFVEVRGQIEVIRDDAAARVEMVSIAERYIGDRAEAFAGGLSDAPRVILEIHPRKVLHRPGKRPGEGAASNH